ncbi:TetR/AcrR family transcriptional regulator [Aureibacillus halotolerans]|uniref:TetR family transcriptional regulator n=1 Tax=Aureibacillus halotolerans TaxID=1508390 RepID=A0A4R6TZC0_9BACI|nr:TetR/AcrR family transcriptional regulator [Aureibacillus halotolerans]TDQ37693.1 TetR family transcriptional regulator [Aureibacillus halotolerans]
MDRRILKTQNAIMEAFVDLVAMKGFDRITINEIAEKADVNRSTVYLHYVDKYDLLEKCMDDHLNQLFTACMPEDGIGDFTSRDAILRTFEYLEEKAFFYTTMLNNNGIPAFRNHLKAKALQSLQQQLKDGFGNDSANNQAILVEFLASGAVGVLEWWIMNGMPYSPAQMVDEFWSLLERIQLAGKPERK